MEFKLIMSGLAALGFVAGISTAQAEVNREAIAERLKPVGEVCVEGQDCGTASAPAQAASGGGDEIDGAGIYNNVCMACHETGAAGAPIRGVEEAWMDRKAQGFATLLEHSINGIGAMPPRGGNPNLSDEEMRAAVAYLVEPVMDVPEESEAVEEVMAEEEATTDVTLVDEEGVEEAEVEPEAVHAEKDNGLDGELLYASSGCNVCHDNGVAGAPILGDADAWAARLEKGSATLYDHAINGFNAMPAKGGNPNLADEEVQAIVDYMMAEAQ
ncbi:c-type cytochrome [Vreelandella rituensis]|uniref:Cytochrome c5 family protein n=1 Tax=Vreelandella rituensis TaxID=2282306 RepID=A0A368U8P6_9GAMM|nr:cytochrome c5 family protein [Halomonas rituensis]